MFIWILAIVLIALLAVIGRYQGAVQFTVSLVGLLVAALLAFPLVPLSKPIVGLIGVKTTFWAWALPPLINFLVIYAIGLAVGYFVHKKVEYHFRYNETDGIRHRFERLNERLGICMGVAMAGVWLVILSVIFFVAGYPTVQLSENDNASGIYKLLNMARRGLNSTGLDKVAARFDPAPKSYYEASDILGLLYNNPLLIGRLAQYPPFLLTGDRPEFQEIANDKEYMNLLATKGDIAQIISNPKTQAIINNAEILQELASQDLNDFRTFLETGKSPKFDEEKILGRWQIDLYATIAQEKKKRPDMSALDMKRVKRAAEFLTGISFIATTDNKAIMKVELSDNVKKLLEAASGAAAAAAASAASSTPSGMPADVAARYGIVRGRQGGPAPPRPATPPAAAKPNPDQVMQTVFSAQGTWKRESEKYVINMQDEQSRQQAVDAIAEGDRLTIAGPNVTLVFSKVL